MSRRKENVRKICDDISALGMLLKVKTGKVNYDVVGDILINSAHKIKRTTWRSDTQYKLDNRFCRKHPLPIPDKPSLHEYAQPLEKFMPSKETKPIAKKDKWNKDWDKYNNAKRINTNQTTTANVDVSTIPYY